MPNRLSPALLVLACPLLLPAPVRAANDCGHTLESVPVEITTILKPAYTNDTQGKDLGAAHRQIELLMLESAHCKLSAQSVPGRDAAADAALAEWAALDQWLYRLSNFVGLSVKGDDSNDWKRELEIFAEVYELEL